MAAQLYSFFLSSLTTTLDNLSPRFSDGFFRMCFSASGERHHEPSVGGDSGAGDGALERGVQRAQHHGGEPRALAGYQGCLRPRQARERKRGAEDGGYAKYKKNVL